MLGKSGKALRLSRLVKADSTPLFVLPLDHTVTDGPFTDNQGYHALLEALATNGADAIVVHKGRLRQIQDSVYAKLSIIVHLSASTKYAPDTNHKYQIGGVEDCLRRGADAISIHVNVGSPTEDQQVAMLASVADACDRLGVPLLAMLYPRGEGIKAHPRVDVLAHAASLAVDLGADIAKLPLAGPVREMREVIRRCPIPLLVAGGSRTSDEEFKALVANAVRSGAHGIAAGRNIFMSQDPGTKVREIRKILDANLIAPDANMAVPATDMQLANVSPFSDNRPAATDKLQETQSTWSLHFPLPKQGMKDGQLSPDDGPDQGPTRQVGARPFICESLPGRRD